MLSALVPGHEDAILPQPQTVRSGRLAVGPCTAWLGRAQGADLVRLRLSSRSRDARRSQAPRQREGLLHRLREPPLPGEIVKGIIRTLAQAKARAKYLAKLHGHVMWLSSLRVREQDELSGT